jgi:hypothetical protein
LWGNGCRSEPSLSPPSLTQNISFSHDNKRR